MTLPTAIPDARTAIRESGYSLKNVKTLDTHDGQAWNATVYKDGKKVGFALNGGTGGPSRIEFVSRTLTADFNQWTATLPDFTIAACSQMEAFSVPATGETVADELIALWESARENKKLDKKARTQLLYRTETDHSSEYELQYRASTPPGGADPNTEAARAQYRATTWWKTVTFTWVIGQGWVPEPSPGRG